MKLVSVLVAVVVGLSAHTAQAQDVSFLGWTGDGKFVVKVADPEHTYDWGKGADAFHAACAPAALGAVLSCAVCAGDAGDPAKECGLTVRPKKLVSNFKSPDKKLTLKKTSKCGTNDVGDAHCSTYIEFGLLGSIDRFDDLYEAKQSKASAYFRADSDAVMVHFDWTQNGTAKDEFHVVDVHDLRVRDTVPKPVTELVGKQLAHLIDTTDGSALYTSDALFFTDHAERGAIAAGSLAKTIAAGASTKIGKVDVVVSADGRAAWAVFTVTGDVSWRVTELIVRQKAEWRIAGGYWSRGMADKDAHAMAADGKLPEAADVTAGGDQVTGPLMDLAQVLRWDNETWIDAEANDGGGFAASRPDVVIVGSAPAERGKGGKFLEKAWRGWVKGGLSVGSFRGAQTESVGWMVVNVKVTKTKAKKTYVIPFRVWMVVESGQVVLAHIAVTQ